MMSRHFALSSELSGAIAKRLPHAKNQLSAAGSFFNQFVTDIYTNINRVLIVRMNEFRLVSKICQLLSRGGTPGTAGGASAVPLFRIAQLCSTSANLF